MAACSHPAVAGARGLPRRRGHGAQCVAPRPAGPRGDRDRARAGRVPCGCDDRRRGRWGHAHRSVWRPRRGKRRAWILATVLDGLTVVLHLMKGLDVEEATLSVLLLLLLVTSGQQFRARPDPRSSGRLVGVMVGGTSVAWIL